MIYYYYDDYAEGDYPDKISVSSTAMGYFKNTAREYQAVVGLADFAKVSGKMSTGRIFHKFKVELDDDLNFIQFL